MRNIPENSFLPDQRKLSASKVATIWRHQSLKESTLPFAKSSAEQEKGGLKLSYLIELSNEPQDSVHARQTRSTAKSAIDGFSTQLMKARSAPTFGQDFFISGLKEAIGHLVTV